MRTAILAGGIAVVRSFAFCFAEDGEWSFTVCSLATGLLGRTALGAKKVASLDGCNLAIQCNLNANS